MFKYLARTRFRYVIAMVVSITAISAALYLIPDNPTAAACGALWAGVALERYWFEPLRMARLRWLAIEIKHYSSGVINRDVQ